MATEQQWDITSSVGITALAVAAGRSIDSHRDDALVDDPFAEDFVHAANPPVPMLTRPPASDSPVDEITQIWTHVANHMGVRSRFFDHYFQRACAAGTRQAVVLASGLDTRGFRLDWPAGFPLFEIDQAKVLEFKEAVLNRAEATSTCERHLVPVDLRADWASALRDTGFDPSLPTAWLAEGLLPYLPAEAEENLLTTIHSLSAPGSRIAIEHIRDMHSLFDEPMLERAANQFGIDIQALVHDDDRADPDTVLASHGWTTTIDPVKDVASDYNREPSSTAGLFAGQSRFVTASLPN